MFKRIQSKGIVRNKTDILLLVKESKRKKMSRFSKESIMGEKELSYELSSSVRKPLVPNDIEKSDQLSKTMTSLPPEWIDQFESCQSILRQIDDISKPNLIFPEKQMMAYQTKRFTVVKESQQKQIQIHIYECASMATKKIKKCQKILQKIQKNSQIQSDSDHKTCKSVTYKIATELRQKTKQIRAQQRAFVQQRKNLEQSTRASFLQMAAEKMLMDDGMDFIEEQQLDLNLDSRNEQILKIVQSIHQLNDLYKQLNALVIIQGSLLDRIDFNIDESFQKVTQGTQHLAKAQTYQKKTSKCAFKVMIFCVLCIAILSIVLAVKWTRK